MFLGVKSSKFVHKELQLIFLKTDYRNGSSADHNSFDYRSLNYLNVSSFVERQTETIQLKAWEEVGFEIKLPFSEQLLSFSSLLVFSFSYLPSNGSLLVVFFLCFCFFSQLEHKNREKDKYLSQAPAGGDERFASAGEHLPK